MEDTPQGGAGGAPGRHHERPDSEPGPAAATEKAHRDGAPEPRTAKSVRAGTPVAEQAEQGHPRDAEGRRDATGRT
ncbi:hypothetical protein ACIRBX_14395 [Kitasatospora sp. NPDC096147]|uniref:hypothetical protein n=1 Tax=Kitasatospora sp. NPDC096147 TaxID=3364093 RepID=UPI003802DB84